MTTEEKVQTAFLNMMEQISFTEITVTALSKKSWDQPAHLLSSLHIHCFSFVRVRG
ncbi:hypothetical protein [Lacticaseibacillus manihotivorans]|uniref:hypothetical protein n=1 Tax=Lacticaseibacillus manihotivorans TaxID=88233 RepID=UPI000B2209CC|nr:hypothetical protein [Lacticaseibacillus manihotivorans]